MLGSVARTIGCCHLSVLREVGFLGLDLCAQFGEVPLCDVGLDWFRVVWSVGFIALDSLDLGLGVCRLTLDSVVRRFVSLLDVTGLPHYLFEEAWCHHSFLHVFCATALHPSGSC